jgi:hypothetical protein
MVSTPGLLRRSFTLAFAVALAGCGSDSATGTKPFTGPALSVVGHGDMTARYMAELWTLGNVAYTSTWGQRGSTFGNAVHIWNIAGATPVLVDSLVIENATTLGDIQTSEDGKLLVVATERANGSIVIYDLTNPIKPARLTRYQTPNTSNGVHTAEVARVNGTLYAFLSIDTPVAHLVIVDLSDPRNPREVLSRNMGNPFVHDVFVRDGLLFTALWNDGVTIWDIGGGGKGGTPANPVQIGNVRTAAWAPSLGSEAHNVWWFQDKAGGASAKRFMFVGEEAPGNSSLLNSSNGDIHVVDVSDISARREVAFYHVDNAGTHNFSVDEQRGVLYAAYYNAGVRALNVRGDLSACTADQKSADGRCDLKKMGRELAAGLGSAGPVYVWGVHFDGNFVYASDMLNGIWKLAAADVR